LHFGACGGCALQDLSPADYRAHKRSIIVDALMGVGLTDAVVEDAIAVSPHTRRRASFKVMKKSGQTLIGFHAAKSHDIIDMRECLVLTPKLFALVERLRVMMNAILHDGEKAELHVTEADNGFDIALRWQRKTTPALIAVIAKHAAALNLARVTSDSEILIELAAPVIRFGKAQVKLPPEAFLQSTREGETALQSLVMEALKGAKNIADLFAGCGTFALVLAERARVHAVELEGEMLDALSAAARATSGLKPVTMEKRDLFKQPLTPLELNAFDAILLDPPRIGASAQVKTISQSHVKRVAYVSCNAASFARDARVLTEGGFRMGPVTPIDQFLWSEHIELFAVFER
jgi:23S rRNA (uracil1939-C5)-methyltransferase